MEFFNKAIKCFEKGDEERFDSIVNFFQPNIEKFCGLIELAEEARTRMFKDTC